MPRIKLPHQLLFLGRQLHPPRRQMGRGNTEKGEREMEDKQGKKAREKRSVSMYYLSSHLVPPSAKYEPECPPGT